jgi:hypothetical protein
MAMVLTGGVFACQDGKYENVFDETPVERRNAYFRQLEATLTGAENGWIMQYFPVADNMGYNISASFDNAGIAVLGVKSVYTDNVYREYTGHYRLTTDGAPSLVFTTYNRALHPFADPDIDKSAAGDFEFVVYDLKPDTVRLKGKWEKTDVRLIRLPSDMTSEEYLRLADETKQLLFAKGSPDLQMDVDGKTYSFSGGYTSILKIHGDGATEIIPYITTTDGFRLYKAFDAGGKQLQNFRLAKQINERDELICTDPGANVRFLTVADDAPGFFLKSLAATTASANVWTIDPNSLGGIFAEAYDQIVKNCKTIYEEDFESLFFTCKTANDGPSLSFKSGQGKYEGAFYIDISPEADKIVFTDKKTTDKNGNAYLEKIPGFNIFLDALGKDGYTITSESAMSVSILKFTQAANPDNRFKILLNI